MADATPPDSSALPVTGRAMAPDVASRARIHSIDALRGLVMLLMRVDHSREFFYRRAQVADPMDMTSVSPAVFVTRVLTHLCVPVFIALTGLSARAATRLAVFGAAPLFFYRLHRYVLHLLNLAARAVFDTGSETLYSVPNIAGVWLIALLVAPALRLACRASGTLKRRCDRAWMRYL